MNLRSEPTLRSGFFVALEEVTPPMTDANPKTAEELGAALQPRHRRFVEAYFALGLNATATARKDKHADQPNTRKTTRVMRTRYHRGTCNLRRKFHIIPAPIQAMRKVHECAQYG